MDDIPEALELALWCAAFATWLMLLFGFFIEPSKAFSKLIRAWLVKIGLKAPRR